MEKAVNITLIADTLTTPLATDTIPPLATDTVRTYLALGDSYTIGQSVSETERFPDQTVQLLKNENIKISNPDIIAVTGWTTANLINALNSNPPKSNYSVVSLLIGVNNQYQRRNIDEYKTEFTLLVNRSIVYAGNNKSHVFILSIPDYSVTPFARNSDTASISKEIDAFNSINKAISEASGVNYLDITSISREALNDPTLVAGDGLHPSGKQYKRWAELLAPLMKKF
ncbi:MAG: SGNH/GDSL hydrolase family protein [Ginsengibacter sp.]